MKRWTHTGGYRQPSFLSVELMECREEKGRISGKIDVLDVPSISPAGTIRV